MVRIKSKDKRNSILLAAAQMFAERGLSAPTVAITNVAGVAEGTLFTYFKTKDELVNVLYREIKVELADAMMTGFPREENVRRRLEHVWNQYVEWGTSNPTQFKVLKQIMVWSGLTEESKKAGMVPFVEIQKIADDAAVERRLKDLPKRFIGAAMSALAETAIELGRQEPELAKEYRRAGFEMLWAGITCEP